MPALLNDPITAETTSAGQPATITWKGSRYHVRVVAAWGTEVYRVAATLDGNPAIAEIARSGELWRLRYWWTS